MHASTRFLLAAIASGATVYAQTSSICNPILTSGCPVDPALAKAVEYDLTQGAPSDFTVSTGSAPTFTKDGAVFTIAKKGDAPTLISKWYMMFGHYDIQVKTAPGVGVISSLVLLSDDLDEVDFEWLGADNTNVQTNYFGKGKTTSYTREMTVPVSSPQESFHTYSLDWTADAIVWSIDGKAVRTLTPQTAETDQYPQSPMQLKIGPWVAGDVGAAQGTVSWAGGVIDWSAAAANPYTMTVTNIKAIDYSTGKSYSYGDNTGNWQSIKSDGGSINSDGNPDTPVSSATAAGTAISATASGAAATNGAVLNNVATNSTSNATVTTGSVPSGTARASQATTILSSAAAPFPTNGTASTTHVSGSAGSSAATGANTQSTPHSAGAARYGASVGAMALAAAVLVL